jgi:hypothetical protein
MELDQAEEKCVVGDGMRGVHAVAGGALAGHVPSQHPLPPGGGAR